MLKSAIRPGIAATARFRMRHSSKFSSIPSADGLSESENAAKLRQSCLTAEEQGEGKHFVLPDGSKWPVINRPALFRRDFYDGCFNGPMASLKVPSKKKFVVFGNRGTDLESFALYLLIRTLREGRAVIFQSADYANWFAFVNGKSYAIKYDQLEDVTSLITPETIVISCRARVPLPFKIESCNCYTVVVTTSPRERKRSGHYHGGSPVLAFPPFEFDEIENMRKVCYPDMWTKEQAQARYDSVGGIPSKVFNPSLSSEELEEDMKAAAEEMCKDMVSFLSMQLLEFGYDNMMVLAHLAQFTDKEIVPHGKLMHYFPFGYYDKNTGSTSNTDELKFYQLKEDTAPASRYIQQYCTGLVQKNDPKRFMEFLRTGTIRT